MGDYFDLYNVRDLKMVDVRKYCGIEDGRHAWIFLGYDVVKTNKEGKAVSIFSSEETEYDYLLLNRDEERNREYYDHDGVAVGDVRVKVIDNPYLEVFGKMPVTSKANIKSWIDKHPGFYFLHYQPVKETAKVKSIK